MGALIGLFGLVAIVVGFVTMIKPIRAVRIPTRARAAAVFGIGLVLFVVGVAMTPTPTSTSTSQGTTSQDAAPAAASTQREAVAETTRSEPAEEPDEPSAGLTMENYLRIQNGMSYAEVVKILGEPGEEMSRSDIAGISTVMYGWKRWTGANMNAMFQDDRLITKAQFGLK